MVGQNQEQMLQIILPTAWSIFSKIVIVILNINWKSDCPPSQIVLFIVSTSNINHCFSLNSQDVILKLKFATSLSDEL